MGTSHTGRSYRDLGHCSRRGGSAESGGQGGSDAIPWATRGFVLSRHFARPTEQARPRLAGSLAARYATREPARRRHTLVGRRAGPSQGTGEYVTAPDRISLHGPWVGTNA